MLGAEPVKRWGRGSRRTKGGAKRDTRSERTPGEAAAGHSGGTTARGPAGKTEWGWSDTESEKRVTLSAAER